MLTNHPEPCPPPELRGAHGHLSPTSIVVFAVTTGSFHRCVTASSSPAQLTDAVPPIQVQGAPAIAVAQPRAALCKAEHTESRSDHPWATASHTLTPHLPAYKMFSHSAAQRCSQHPGRLVSLGTAPSPTGNRDSGVEGLAQAAQSGSSPASRWQLGRGRDRSETHTLCI